MKPCQNGKLICWNFYFIWHFSSVIYVKFNKILELNYDMWSEEQSMTVSRFSSCPIVGIIFFEILRYDIQQSLALDII